MLYCANESGVILRLCCSYFGLGSGLTHISRVFCHGSETTITQCSIIESVDSLSRDEPDKTTNTLTDITTDTSTRSAFLMFGHLFFNNNNNYYLKIKIIYTFYLI